METAYATIRNKVPRGRPRLSDEERRKARKRSVILRRCASLARSRTLMVFKADMPERYKEIYDAEYKALKRERLRDL